MNEIIESQNVTLQSLSDALDAAVIDWLPHDENSIYVTGSAFPAFQKIDSDRKLVVMWTYLDVVPGVEVSEILSLLNDLNRRLIMVQFSYDADAHRMYGYYVLSYREGFNPRQIIRAGRSLAEIFDDAAEEGISKRLLVPLDQCTGADEFFGNTTH